MMSRSGVWIVWMNSTRSHQNKSNEFECCLRKKKQFEKWPENIFWAFEIKLLMSVNSEFRLQKIHALRFGIWAKKTREFDSKVEIFGF